MDFGVSQNSEFVLRNFLYDADDDGAMLNYFMAKIGDAQLLASRLPLSLSVVDFKGKDCLSASYWIICCAVSLQTTLAVYALTFAMPFCLSFTFSILLILRIFESLASSRAAIDTLAGCQRHSAMFDDELAKRALSRFVAPIGFISVPN